MRIGILTGGGDVAGLNTVIRDVVYRAAREKEKVEVVGIRRGWGCLIYHDPEKKDMNPEHAMVLDEESVRNIDGEGGTWLRTSRTNPLKVTSTPDLKEFRGFEFEGKRDMSLDAIKNLENWGIDSLIAVGGDDTLSFARYLKKIGFPVMGVPKTVDGDVAGTDYCIGFATGISRATDYLTSFRSCLGSHERIGVVEIFGRDAGFTGLYTAFAAKPDRVVIPEVDFDMDKLVELLYNDRIKNERRYSLVLASEGAKQKGSEVVYEGKEFDQFNHKKLGGIGKIIESHIKKKLGVETMSERIAYRIRSGIPDAKDRIFASIFANIVFDSITRGNFGMMAAIKNGKPCLVPLEDTENSPKKVDVERFYNSERYRPNYKNLRGSLLLL
ncbi:MAG: 6-phosphofructokinase [Nanoarchaeota archaeon]